MTPNREIRDFMAQSKKQLENDFVYWMDKSQKYSNAIRKLSEPLNKAATEAHSTSLAQTAKVMTEKKGLQKLKTDADACAKEIQRKISELSNNR
jgi:hypothetical protein